jgi:hypothetical protein
VPKDEMAEPSIPSPRDDDPEDVHWALTTAASLQAQGDQVEALRWLRRAAEAASQASDASRATELVKRVAELAGLLGGAPTDRGKPATGDSTQGGAMPHGLGLPVGSAAAAQVDEARQGLMDDLDEPTCVDSRPPLELAAEVISRAAEKRAGREAALAARLKDEITLIPGTQKAAGVESAIQAERAAQFRRIVPEGEVDRRPTCPAPAPQGYLDDVDDDGTEVTESMVLPPNIGDINEEADAARSALGSVTLPALTSVDPSRVALVQVFDGGGPRVLPLAPDEEAPPGSAVALLVPSSREDARRVASMLGAKPDGRDKRGG